MCRSALRSECPPHLPPLGGNRRGPFLRAVFGEQLAGQARACSCSASVAIRGARCPVPTALPWRRIRCVRELGRRGGAQGSSGLAPATCRLPGRVLGTLRSRLPPRRAARGRSGLGGVCAAGGACGPAGGEGGRRRRSPDRGLGAGAACARTWVPSAGAWPLSPAPSCRRCCFCPRGPRARRQQETQASTARALKLALSYLET